MSFPSVSEGPGTIHRLKKDETAVVQRFPADVLRLLDMVVRELKHVPYDLDAVVDEIVSANPALARDSRCKRLRRLIAAARP